MEKKPRSENEDQAPLFKSWTVWYGVVIGNLAIMILLFYLISRIYQ